MLTSKRKRSASLTSDIAESSPIRPLRYGVGSTAPSMLSAASLRRRAAFPREPSPEAAEDEERSSEEGEEGTPQRVLALHASGQNNIAAAVFDPETRRLELLEDTKDTWAWDLALLLAEQIAPHDILLSQSAPDSLLKVVAEYSRHFSVALGLYNVAKVRLPGQANRARPEQPDIPGLQVSEDDAGMGQIRLALMKMGCRINVDATNAVCAAGAVLAHIQPSLGDQINGDDDGYDLDSIGTLNLCAHCKYSDNSEEHMLINNDALTSLAVLDVDPDAAKVKHKQHLTLNGELNTTVTPLGRKLFHIWLLRPLANIERINARLDAVGVLAAKENHQVLKGIKKELKHVKNILNFCQKIRSGRASWKDWQGLVEGITAAVDIVEHITSLRLRNHIEMYAELKASASEQVQLFLQDTVALIDWDMSRDENRVCIRSMIDEELDQWREDYARESHAKRHADNRTWTFACPPTIINSSQQNQMTRIMIKRIPPDMCQYLNVVYLPQLGCLVAANDIGDPSLIPEDWEQRFTTDEATWFKTPEMHNLDAHYGDLQNIIIDREIEWVQKLAGRIDEIWVDLHVIAEGLAQLDCLVAFAEAANRLDLRRPVLKEEPVLKIHKGWHPLYAQAAPAGQYIDNNTAIAGGADRELGSMMIVTGANGSGKSAYGKQVALITYMAHIGCFVPAQKAEIGICDKIFTRVQTRESASKTASAFMIDLSQVSQALRGASSRSLLILDEFGKGTTPADGAGLLAGVIGHLINGVQPRTVILTHFHELFAQQFIDPELPIKYCHMKSLLMEGSNELTYLYKLVPEVCQSSNAAECALKHGIPEAVVARAREVTYYLSSFQLSQLINEQLTQVDAQELEAAEQLTRRFLSWDLNDEGILNELRTYLAPDERSEPENEHDQSVFGGSVLAIERLHLPAEIVEYD